MKNYEKYPNIQRPFTKEEYEHAYGRKFKDRHDWQWAIIHWGRWYCADENATDGINPPVNIYNS